MRMLPALDEVGKPSKQPADDVRDNEDKKVDIEADSASEISCHDLFEECVEQFQSFSDLNGHETRRDNGEMAAKNALFGCTFWNALSGEEFGC